MRGTAVALGGLAVAGLCCLAVPIVAAAIGGAISVAVIGWGGLAVAAVAAGALAIVRVRRQRGRRGDR